MQRIGGNAHNDEGHLRRCRRALPWLIVALGAGLVLSACHQNATVFAVDTTIDTVDANAGDGLCADSVGNCSLRAAVMEANATPGVEEIRLTDGETYPLSLIGADDTSAMGDLDILEAVVMTGSATITVGNPFIGRLIQTHHPSGLVEIDGPDLVGAHDSFEQGAALVVSSSGDTSLLRSEVTGNNAQSAIVLVTGNGTLYLWSSTVHANTFGLTSSAVRAAAGRLDLQNTTIEGDQGFLGAIPAVSVGAAATATAVHSTILGQWAGGGTVTASIVEKCGATPPVSGGRNVNPDGSCGFSAAGDQTVDPQLGPIQDNGGPVLTAAPPVGSAAQDTGGGGCTIFSLDARDLPRPRGASCDTGAVELQSGPDCGSPGPGAQMQYCDLTGQLWTGLDLTGADLTGSIHINSGPHLFTNFTNTILVDTDLTNSNFSSATITGADFTGATLTSFRAANLTGTAAALPTNWSQIGSNLIGPHGDVTGFDFTNHDLSSVIANDLESAGADYTNANLTNAIFDRADFGGADLRGTTTTGASFTNANWDNTWCPDGTLSTTNPGQTCAGHL